MVTNKVETAIYVMASHVYMYLFINSHNICVSVLTRGESALSQALGLCVSVLNSRIRNRNPQVLRGMTDDAMAEEAFRWSEGTTCLTLLV